MGRGRGRVAGGDGQLRCRCFLVSDCTERATHALPGPLMLVRRTSRREKAVLKCRYFWSLIAMSYSLPTKPMMRCCSENNP